VLQFGKWLLPLHSAITKGVVGKEIERLRDVFFLHPHSRGRRHKFFDILAIMIAARQ